MLRIIRAVARRPRSTFAALRVPNYALYWVALVFYVFGHRAEYVTIAWIVWELTQSPLTLGYLGLAQGVPLLVFQLVGGVVADRADRLRVLLVTQLFTAATMTVAFVVTVSGTARVELLFVLAIVSSVFRAFDEPTRMAMIPQLVDRERLSNAIALGSIPWQAGRMVGSCGITKRSGWMMCGALRSSTSRSASALRTSENS